MKTKKILKDIVVFLDVLHSESQYNSKKITDALVGNDEEVEALKKQIAELEKANNKLLSLAINQTDEKAKTMTTIKSVQEQLAELVKKPKRFLPYHEDWEKITGIIQQLDTIK